MTVGASCIVMEEPARPITGPAKEEETIEAVDSMMALCGKLPGPFVCTFHAVHCECHVPRIDKAEDTKWTIVYCM